MNKKIKKINRVIAFLMVLFIGNVFPALPTTAFAAPLATPTAWHVVYDLNGGSGTPPEDTTVYAGTPTAITNIAMIKDITDGTVTPPSGKRFAGWSVIPTGAALPDYAPGRKVSVSVNGLYLYAIWREQKSGPFDVTFRTKIKAVTVPAITGVNLGATITKPADPAYPGYLFQGWYKDSMFRDAWDFVTDAVAADTVLHAKWLEDETVTGRTAFRVKYDDGKGHVFTDPIDYTPNPAGNINTTLLAYRDATVLSAANLTGLDLTPPAGKEFVGWDTDKSATHLELKATDRLAVKEEGHTLYAVYRTPKTYDGTITVDFTDEKQTMTGFGNSLAFHRAAGYKKMYEDYKAANGLPDSQQTEANNPALRLIALNMDNKTGAGFDIYRAIIGDGAVATPLKNGELPGIVNQGNISPKYQWGNFTYDGGSDTIWPEPGDWDLSAGPDYSASNYKSGLVWNLEDWANHPEKVAEFDDDQIFFMKQAQKLNTPVRFYGSVWSVPYWMKTNLSVRNDYPHNPINNQPKTTYTALEEEYYQAFADYLVEYAWGMWAWFGIPMYAISPTNEPEIDHSYSAQVLRGDDYERFMLDYFKPTLDKALANGKFAPIGVAGSGTGLTAVAPLPLISAPEGTRIDRTTSPIDLGTPDRPGYGALMANPEVQGFTSVLSTHLYEYDQFRYEPRTADAADPWYPDWVNVYNTADDKGSVDFSDYNTGKREIWMTEIGQQYTNTGVTIAQQTGMFNAFYWANRFANVFDSVPGFSSYHLWIALYTGSESRLVNFATAGSNQKLTGQYRAFKKFYGTAQFSDFIDAGYIHVGVDDRYPAKGVTVTAYKAGSGSDFSVIAYNESDTPQTFTMTLSGTTASALQAFRTTVRENLRKLSGTITPTGGQNYQITLPAESITTFVPVGAAKAAYDGFDIYDPYSILEAEDEFADASGISSSVTNGTVSVKNGESLKYRNFNFADGVYSNALHVISMYANNVDSIGKAGGLMEVRVGSTTGKVIGRFAIPANKAAATYAAQLDTSDLGGYGIKDLVLVFKGGSGVLFDIDNFTFDAAAQPNAPANLVTNGAISVVNIADWAATAAPATVSRNTARFRSSGASLLVQNRNNASQGGYQAVSGLVNGTTYNIGAFVLPYALNAFATDAFIDDATAKDAVVTGVTATVELASFNGGTKVNTLAIITRGGINSIDWSQVAGEFTYVAPAAGTFDQIRLIVSTNNTNAFFVDDVTLTPKEAVVSFVSNGGGAVGPVITRSGEKLTAPAISLNGYTLRGWYTDSTLTTKWDFDTAVKGDMTLYAAWTQSAGGWVRPPAGSGSSSSSSSSSTGTETPASTGSAVTPTTPEVPETPSSTASGSIGSLAEFSDAGLVADWALGYFAKLISANVISGYSDGTLRPKGNVTRAEFTKLIVAGLNIPAGGTPKSFPADVNAGDWYKEFVDIASAYDIVRGVSDTSFAPNANVTRQDLASIAYRALIYLKVSIPAPDGSKFTDDAGIADYAKDAVTTLKQMGIVSGRTDGSFDPLAFATREETAKIISGVMDAAATVVSAAAEASAAESASSAETATVPGTGAEVSETSGSGITTSESAITA